MVLTPPFPILREESAFHVSCAMYNRLSLPFLAPALCHGLCVSRAAAQLWLEAEWVRRLLHSQPWEHQAETAFGHQNTHSDTETAWGWLHCTVSNPDKHNSFCTFTKWGSQGTWSCLGISQGQAVAASFHEGLQNSFQIPVIAYSLQPGEYSSDRGKSWVHPQTQDIISSWLNRTHVQYKTQATKLN